MQHRQGDPFRFALSPADRDVFDAIRARSIAGFGHDAFRMEDGSGGGDGGGQGGDGGQGASDQGGVGQGSGQRGAGG